MIRAALYLRQSLDVQEGIDRQRIRTTQLATLRGWTVVETFEDNDVSASKERKAGTAWAKMLAGAQAGDFTHLIAVDLDRLIRTQRDLLTLIDLKLSVVTVDGEVDLSTADGEFRASLMTSVARFEVRRKTERQIRASDHRAAQGRVIGGKRAFGYEQDRKTIRESEAVHIRAGVAAIINGGSIRSVAKSWNEQGVLTSTGRTWGPTQLKKVLEAPRNAGHLVQRGQVLALKSEIQPIVTPEDHALLLNILANNGTANHGPRKASNWLSSLMTCGACGAPMLVKMVNSPRSAERTRNYMCTHGLHGTGEPGVRHVSINADIAERQVTLAMYGAANIAARWGVDDTEGTTLRELSERAVALRQRRADATDLLLEPGVDKQVIRARLAEYAVELAEVERAQAEAIAGNAEMESMRMLIRDPRTEGDLEFTRRWMDWWRSLNDEARRNLVRATVSIDIEKGGKGAKRVKVAAR
jgi:site-specific DNA recombinase